MSIWGPLPADNDDAADWLAEYLDAPDLIQLNDAFDEVLDPERGDYLEITEGSNAVVAAAIVAEVFGSPSTEPLVPSDQLHDLQELATSLSVGARTSILKRAILALKKAADDVNNSELFQLMSESPELGEPWRDAIESLKSRLLELEQGFANR